MLVPDPDTSRTDDVESNEPSTGLELPRRKLLKGTAATGALLLGAGSATANGKGGQAVVEEGDFRPDAKFVITEVDDCPDEATNPDGSCWAPTLFFQCNGQGGAAPPGKGGTLPFPYWDLQYYDEDGNLEAERVKLYTRDNEINAGDTYRWTSKGKECPDGLVQAGFAAGGE